MSVREKTYMLIPKDPKPPLSIVTEIYTDVGWDVLLDGTTLRKIEYHRFESIPLYNMTPVEQNDLATTSPWDLYYSIRDFLTQFESDKGIYFQTERKQTRIPKQALRILQKYFLNNSHTRRDFQDLIRRLRRYEVNHQIRMII